MRQKKIKYGVVHNQSEKQETISLNITIENKQKINGRIQPAERGKL